MSNVATGSTSVSLLTVDEVKKLNSELLNEYLRRRLKDTKNINKHANTITVDQEVDGSNFLDLTLDNLLSIQIPLGPAKDIEKLINEIKGGNRASFFQRFYMFANNTEYLHNLVPFFLLLIVKPAQKTHSRYRSATRCW
jgi:hypothetical protein